MRKTMEVWPASLAWWTSTQLSPLSGSRSRGVSKRNWTRGQKLKVAAKSNALFLCKLNALMWGLRSEKPGTQNKKRE